MAMSQQHIGPNTPMGANAVDGGVTFRVWAPRATQVHVRGDFNNWELRDDCLLVKDESSGHWTGFQAGIGTGARYKFHVQGEGGPSWKRDPYARELTDPVNFPGSYWFPRCECIVRSPRDYPWHDGPYRSPRFNDLVVYQLHVGAFYARDANGADARPLRVGRFLDVLFRLEYFIALGINALQLLPIDEFPSERSRGYNGVDLFSPETGYAVPVAELPRYLDEVNRLLQQRGIGPLLGIDNLRSHADQLRALVDLCHVYGVAVLFDVVYNHAGPDFGEEGLWRFDMARDGGANGSLYFTDQVWSSGNAFALWDQKVRQFLIDNAGAFLDEFHVDGFRFDEVSGLLKTNASGGGWIFCRDVTGTLRTRKPEAILICEHWPPDAFTVHPTIEGNALGFDAVWHDGLRRPLRDVIAQAAHGRDAYVEFAPLVGFLENNGLPAQWKAVNYVESHDEVDFEHAGAARIACLADPGNRRSWYARSRSRVAAGVLMTGPGIPMLFMGQEFLEDKTWSDNPVAHPGTLIWWDGLERGEPAMKDHLRFMQELIWLRRRQPALRGGTLRILRRGDDRILAFHRWLEAAGRDVIVAASLNESIKFGYRLGFPFGGRWLEVFNSDIYDNWVNPSGVGNGGQIFADGPGWDGFAHSAVITIPANGFVVFARDPGDP